MKDLRHEYERGLILKVTFFGNLLRGGDLIYLFACPLPEAQMGSRHCTAAAVIYMP